MSSSDSTVQVEDAKQEKCIVGKAKGSRKGKNKGAGKVQPELALFEEVMLRTVHEMIIDLTKMHSPTADEIRELTRELTGEDLLRKLRDETSSLCNGIVKGCSDLGPTGARYLSVFTMIQPALTLPKICVPRKVVRGENPPGPAPRVNNKKLKGKGKGKDKTKNNITAASSSTAASPAETVQQLLGDTKDKELLVSLADSIFKDLELDEHADQNMSMQDMMVLMSRVGGVVQEKVSNGDIDMEKLQEQAMSFCNQIQHNPDMQNIITSNPVLAGLQGNLPTSGNDASTSASEPPAFGNMLMGMLGQFQS